LIDAVFADPDAHAGVGPDLKHYSVHAGRTGLVELWPLAPDPQDGEAKPWPVANENTGRLSGPQLLAGKLADWIAGLLSDKTALESQGRTIEPQDVLVLLRRRGFDRALVPALKKRGI